MGSMAQWDKQKLVSHGLCRGPGCDSRQFLFSLVFIKNFKTINQNTRRTNFTICIVLSRAPHNYL